MTDTFKPKRKNDDEKPKGLPRNRLIVVVGLLALAMCIVTISLIVRTRSMPGAPIGHLTYMLNDTPYILDFATGERAPITDTSQNPPFPSTSGNISPDGKWRISEGEPPNTQPDYSAAELWLTNLETQETERLTTDTFAQMWPVFSPDGTKIAFVATPDGYRRLYVMDLATHEVTSLAPEMFSYWPSWSPDGEWIAFMTDHTGSSDIWIVRADGSEFQPIAITPDREYDVVWLP